MGRQSEAWPRPPGISLGDESHSVMSQADRKGAMCQEHCQHSKQRLVPAQPWNSPASSWKEHRPVCHTGNCLKVTRALCTCSFPSLEPEQRKGISDFWFLLPLVGSEIFQCICVSNVHLPSEVWGHPFRNTVDGGHWDHLSNFKSFVSNHQEVSFRTRFITSVFSNRPNPGLKKMFTLFHVNSKKQTDKQTNRNQGRLSVRCNWKLCCRL